jgi:tetratricopeptide (TPR) repeat protein
MFKAAYASYNARVQAGDAALRARRYDAASEHYEAAAERAPELDLPVEPLSRPEVLHNNRALADAQLGHPRAAAQAAGLAVAADPMNPLFLETQGYAFQRLGDLERAERSFKAAVRSDPTLHPAWNNLGVVLARRDRLEEAAEAFRRAVGAEPGYAIAWFNLGVTLQERGPRHAAGSQGAFGRAFRADESLRDRERRLIPDNEVYFASLDLSKPLPPEWTFAESQKQAPAATAGFALLLLVGLRLGRALAATGLGPGGAKPFLDLGRSVLSRVPERLVFVSGAVAVLATMAVFLWPLFRSAQGSLTSALLLVVGVGALIAIVVRSRVLAARRAGVALSQRGWGPGIVFGAGAALLGVGWAPLPVARTSRAAPAVHWIGPVLTGATALCLLVLSAWLSIPSTRGLAAAALVMTASLLTPIEPLDGGVVAKGPAGIAAGVAVAGAAVFLLLGFA